MVCLGCHQGGNQWHLARGALLRPFVPRRQPFGATAKLSLLDNRFAPHAPQGDLLRGRAGHALPGPGPLEASPPHLTVPGGCVGCHVRPRPEKTDPRRGLVGGHSFAMFSGDGDDRVENTTACEPCHGEVDSLNREVRYDYDGDGQREGIFDEVEGLLASTKGALDATITEKQYTDGSRHATSFGELDGYVVLVDDAGETLGSKQAPMTIPEEDDGLYRLIFNYMLVVKDRSKGVHNPVWTVRLLQRSILKLTPREVPRWHWR